MNWALRDCLSSCAAGRRTRNASVLQTACWRSQSSTSVAPLHRFPALFSLITETITCFGDATDVNLSRTARSSEGAALSADALAIGSVFAIERETILMSQLRHIRWFDWKIECGECYSQQPVNIGPCFEVEVLPTSPASSTRCWKPLCQRCTSRAPWKRSSPPTVISAGALPSDRIASGADFCSLLPWGL